ncbi:MAG: hypothetical protein MZV64_63000 [Ignavibacteriales bacterium]|nr:hypothetical protein [Ignavibacteriales bacterium]
MTFLFLRLGVMAVASGSSCTCSPKAETSRALMNLALTLALVDAAGIAVMIYILGGFLTSYVPGPEHHRHGHDRPHPPGLPLHALPLRLRLVHVCGAELSPSTSWGRRPRSWTASPSRPGGSSSTT